MYIRLSIADLVVKAGFVRTAKFLAKVSVAHLFAGSSLFLRVGFNRMLGSVRYASALGDDKECIAEAIQVFKPCKAKEYLKQAKEALESLL